MNYEVWSDGSCYPNPGPGGWAFVALSPDGQRLEVSGGESESTNNRMELTAALRGLEHVPDGAPVVLVTDSAYVKEGLESYVDIWRDRGWWTSGYDGEVREVKNRDLWELLVVERDRVDFSARKVKGHSGEELNELCDQMAARERMAQG